jgi:hypothetical protein
MERFPRGWFTVTFECDVIAYKTTVGIYPENRDRWGVWDPAKHKPTMVTLLVPAGALIVCPAISPHMESHKFRSARARIIDTGGETTYAWWPASLKTQIQFEYREKKTVCADPFDENPDSVGPGIYWYADRAVVEGMVRAGRVALP